MPKVTPPRDRTYLEVFRYIIQTCDADEPNMDYIVSLWSYSLANDGLTDAQIKTIRPYCIKYLKANGINPDELSEPSND